MAYGTRVTFEPLRTAAFGAITGSYSAVGGPLLDHARLINFSNTVNQSILISIDGVTDQLFLAPDSFEILDLTANKVRDDGLFLARGTILYARYPGSAGTSGTLYIGVMQSAGGK